MTSQAVLLASAEEKVEDAITLMDALKEDTLMQMDLREFREDAYDVVADHPAYREIVDGVIMSIVSIRAALNSQELKNGILRRDYRRLKDHRDDCILMVKQQEREMDMRLGEDVIVQGSALLALNKDLHDLLKAASSQLNQCEEARRKSPSYSEM